MFAYLQVKNHLNYKPFRCPQCSYQSCEQSKARRHIEHVHSISGDSLISEVEENIKQRIMEMKAKCFPMLGHGEAYRNNLSGSNSNVNSPQQLMVENNSSPEDDSSMDMDAISNSGLDESLGANSTSYKCQMCKELIPMESMAQHVRMHVGKPYKCAICRMRFWTEEKLENHVRGFHPGRNVEEVCGLQVAAAAEAYCDEV